MKVKKIEYPLYFDDIEDINNGNIDVFVELEDGMEYTMVVTTPKFYYTYMDKENINYIPASPPDIIVRCLTKDNIQQAIESYIEEDAYWLKLYYLAGKREGVFDIETMNRQIDVISRSNDEIV
jgi:hypothetical protein